MMNLRYLLPALCLTVLSSVAVADNATDLANFKKAIRAQYDIAEMAYAKKDAETIVSNFFTKDATTIPPGPTVATGYDEILAGYKQHLDGKMKLVSYKTRVNGDTGTDLANFYYTPDDAKEKPGVFKVLFVWVKQNGKWLCSEEMFFPGEFPVKSAGAK